MNRALRIASCMAENAMPFARAVADYLDRRLGAAVEFVEDIPWQEREQALYRGEIDLCWICGLPYARQRDARPGSVEPLAAAVPKAPRYAGRAVYFSDVVVRAGSAAMGLDDLRGARWAFNEPNSHSGHNVLLAHVGASFFGALEEAGSHEEAIRRVVGGASDAAAIDSTVLETELRRRPGIGRGLRVVASLGPSPAPPWVCSGGLPAAVRAAVADALAGMHRDPSGGAILAEAGLSRVARVADSDYDPIRRLDAKCGLEI